jgi:hypothetical protein
MRADRTLRRWLFAACAFGGLLLSGCGGKARLIEFNERLVGPARKVKRATDEFLAAAGSFIAGKDPRGKPFPVGKFQTSYDRLKEVVAAARKEAAALQAPPASGARKFSDSFQHFLEVSEETLADFRAVRDAPEKEPEARRHRLQGLLDGAHLRAQAAWAQMDAAQQAFARDNEIKLK